MLTAIPAAYR